MNEPISVEHAASVLRHLLAKIETGESYTLNVEPESQAVYAFGERDAVGSIKRQGIVTV